MLNFINFKASLSDNDFILSNEHFSQFQMNSTDPALSPWSLSTPLSMVFPKLLIMNIESNVAYRFEYIFSNSFKTLINFFNFFDTYRVCVSKNVGVKLY